MRIIFAGTPEFARVAMASLAAAGHDIPLVLSQPDRPAGRGLKLQASPVKQYALEIGAAVAQPRSLRLDGKYPEDAAVARQAIVDAKADVMVVAAYGLILPQWVLDTPRLGCLNIHASLLPRWRGAAPIHRAIEAGDTQTGITIMQMDAGLDTGDMLLIDALPIAPTDTTGSLHDKLAELGGRMIVQALSTKELRRTPQPETGITYAHKIEKAEAAIDWTQDAAAIVRRVHAFDPFPGAASGLAGENLKIWNTSVADLPRPSEAVPGQIVVVAPEGLAVAAGNGVVHITEVQRPGGKRMAVRDFVRGTGLTVGQIFDARAA